eukprot:1569829-Rhodomonas_salina.2
MGLLRTVVDEPETALLVTVWYAAPVLMMVGGCARQGGRTEGHAFADALNDKLNKIYEQVRACGDEIGYFVMAMPWSDG